MWNVCKIRSCSELENLRKPVDVRKRKQNHGLRLTLYVYVMADLPIANPSLPWLWDCGQNRTSASHLRNGDYNACLVC